MAFAFESDNYSWLLLIESAEQYYQRRLLVFHSLISYAKEKTTFTEFIENENISVVYVFYAAY